MKVYEWGLLSERERLRVLQRPATGGDGSLAADTAKIVEAVRSGGDKAVRALTLQHDGVDVPQPIVGPAEFKDARGRVTDEVKSAIRDARDRIRTFHAACMQQPVLVETAPGVECRSVARPISPVGLYVPAGSAPLPSTALMLCVPAVLAGCEDIWIATPPDSSGRADASVLVAAEACGIENVYKAGGAQAVGAMAYGTETLPKCSKVFGPGNAWVTEAKQQISADPGGAAIDMPAGPSEVMVVADDGANPDFVAADLLSQCEHGPDSHAVLVSDSRELIEASSDALKRRAPELRRRDIVAQSLSHAVALLTESIDDSIAVANAYAAEHLLLQVSDPEAAVEQIRHAGSVFLGPWSPEAIGDYCSGTNHVLPTYGYARTYSGVSCASFCTRMTIQRLSKEGLMAIGDTARSLARAEQLDAHEAAVSIRMEVDSAP